MKQVNQSCTEIKGLTVPKELYRNTPSKLQPFNWKNDSYFEDFIEEGIERKVERIKSILNLTTLRTDYVKSSYDRLMAEGGYGDYTRQQHESYSARLGRHTARDLKKMAELLIDHLEQIEMTGEWK